MRNLLVLFFWLLACLQGANPQAGSTSILKGNIMTFLDTDNTFKNLGEKTEQLVLPGYSKEQADGYVNLAFRHFADLVKGDKWYSLNTASKPYSSSSVQEMDRLVRAFDAKLLRWRWLPLIEGFVGKAPVYRQVRLPDGRIFATPDRLRLDTFGSKQSRVILPTAIVRPNLRWFNARDPRFQVVYHFPASFYIVHRDQLSQDVFRQRLRDSLSVWLRDLPSNDVREVTTRLLLLKPEHLKGTLAPASGRTRLFAAGEAASSSQSEANQPSDSVVVYRQPPQFFDFLGTSQSRGQGSGTSHEDSPDTSLNLGSGFRYH